jgi:phage terminase large subunit-like protein
MVIGGILPDLIFRDVREAIDQAVDVSAKDRFQHFDLLIGRRAVNPGLQHGYPDIDGLRQLAREAKERPSDRDAFQQFHLGIRQEHSVSPFVDLDVYDEGAAAFDLHELEGQPCWLAVDLSSNNDLTVIVACWRDGNDGYFVWPRFFCPKDNLQPRGPIATACRIPPGRPMN